MNRKAAMGFLLLAGLPAAASASILFPLENGSFEDPTLTTNGSLDRTNGSTVGSWTANLPAGTKLRLNNGTKFNLSPYDGAQFYAFNNANATPGGSFFQDFPTLPTQYYSVSFVVGRVSDGVGDQGIRSTVFGDPQGANTEITSLDAPSPAANGPWTQYQYFFYATSAITRLQFSDISLVTNGVDPGIDNVVVQAIPEPTLSGLVGFAMLASLPRRSRRRPAKSV